MHKHIFQPYDNLPVESFRIFKFHQSVTSLCQWCCRVGSKLILLSSKSFLNSFLRPNIFSPSSGRFDLQGRGSAEGNRTEADVGGPEGIPEQQEVQDGLGRGKAGRRRRRKTGQGGQKESGKKDEEVSG